MIVLDLALQGIADLVGSMRVRLQSGYNAVVAPHIKSDTILTGLTHLLYSSGYDPEALSIQAAGARSTGGGVTLMTADGSTYRIVRDLVAGSAQLMEFDRKAKVFTKLSSDPAEISQFLRARVGLPSQQTFESTFVLRASDLPSGPGPAELSTAGEAEAPPDPDALRVKLEEAEKIMREKARIEELEFELDGMQKRRFDLEDEIKGLSVDRTPLEEAHGQLKRMRYLDPMPNDFGPRYEEYLKLAQRRDADMERWQAERDGIDRADRTGGKVDPLASDWRLWTGLGVGTAAIAVAFVLGGVFRYVAYLDIPAYGLSAFLLFRNLTQRENREQVGYRKRLSDQRRAKIMEKNHAELEAVEAIINQVGFSGPGEVRSALKTRAEIQVHVAAIEKQIDEAEKNPRIKALHDERAVSVKRIAVVEEELTTMTAVPIDAMTVKAEIERLRTELEEIEAKTAPADGVSLSDLEAINPEGPFSDGLKAALDLMLTDPKSAAKTLSERASLIIRPLSGNRLVTVVLDASGDVLMKSAQGNAVTWDSMQGEARDLVYLALRGALFAAIEERVRAPMIAGELEGYMAGGREVTQTLFTTLAHAGQILHLVRRKDEAPQAKHVVEVAPP